MNDMLNACSIADAKAMLITDGFLLDVLTRAEDDYALSSAVAKAIFEKLPGVDTVAFPSQRQYGALDFAVRTERVWETWGITSVQQAHARHLAQGFFELTNGRDISGITFAGDLQWEDAISSHVEATPQLSPPWFKTAQ